MFRYTKIVAWCTIMMVVTARGDAITEKEQLFFVPLSADQLPTKQAWHAIQQRVSAIVGSSLGMSLYSADSITKRNCAHVQKAPLINALRRRKKGARKNRHDNNAVWVAFLDTLTLHKSAPQVMAIETFLGCIHPAIMLTEQKNDNAYEFNIEDSGLQSLGNVIKKLLATSIEHSYAFAESEIGAIRTYTKALQTLYDDYAPEDINKLIQDAMSDMPVGQQEQFLHMYHYKYETQRNHEYSGTILKLLQQILDVCTDV